jgi:hypothetical protein
MPWNASTLSELSFIFYLKKGNLELSAFLGMKFLMRGLSKDIVKKFN